MSTQNAPLLLWVSMATANGSDEQLEFIEIELTPEILDKLSDESERLEGNKLTSTEMEVDATLFALHDGQKAGKVLVSVQVDGNVTVRHDIECDDGTVTPAINAVPIPLALLQSGLEVIDLEELQTRTQAIMVVEDNLEPCILHNDAFPGLNIHKMARREMGADFEDDFMNALYDEGVDEGMDLVTCWL
jgi:hypothetical protein